MQRSSSVGTATFANAGTFRKQTGTGTTTIGGSITFNNSGTVDVQSWHTGTGQRPDKYRYSHERSRNNNPGSLTSNSGGIVRGVGTYSGPLQFNSGSTLHPGLSPGILTSTGAVTMTSGTYFAVELNGTAPGTGHGQFLMSGSRRLDQPWRREPRPDAWLHAWRR